MLFSRDDVASYVNEHFEPVWESVRPVPKVTIDFGNGKKITRTLHGNIATYVCTANGDVVDVVPGIYVPSTYIERLSEIARIASSLPGNRDTALGVMRNYHENPIEAVKNAPKDHSSKPLVVPYTVPMRKLTGLYADTQQNEKERRDQIHKYLSDAGGVTPDQMKKWLYREILHADLDDPYLGVDKALSGTYPFDDSHS